MKLNNIRRGLVDVLYGEVAGGSASMSLASSEGKVNMEIAIEMGLSIDVLWGEVVWLVQPCSWQVQKEELTRK